MKQFYSLSSNPGTTGKKFYSNAFRDLQLDYTYTPLKCDAITPDVLETLRQSDGFSVSMPLKRSIIPYLDSADNLVYDYNLCNTVLVKDNKFHGYNTDFYGAAYALSKIRKNASIAILGNGAMAVMVFKMLNGNAKIYSRQKENWNEIETLSDVVINCTSLGMAQTPTSPFKTFPDLSMVIDFTINPTNELGMQCFIHDVDYIDGMSIYKHQFLKQLYLYTGVSMQLEDIHYD